MKYYEFNVTISGTGDTPKEAWADAWESASQDIGSPPEDYKIFDDDSDDETSVEFETENVVPCPLCGGICIALGVLGKRMHYRCQNCGAGFSREVKAVS